MSAVAKVEVLDPLRRWCEVPFDRIEWRCDKSWDPVALRVDGKVVREPWRVLDEDGVVIAEGGWLVLTPAPSTEREGT